MVNPKNGHGAFCYCDDCGAFGTNPGKPTADFPIERRPHETIVLPCGHPAACYRDGACGWCAEVEAARRSGRTAGYVAGEGSAVADGWERPIDLDDGPQFWRVEKEGSNFLHLEAEGWFAVVRADGCAEFHRSPGCGDEPDFLHVCEMEPFVRAVREVLAHGWARWPGEWERPITAGPVFEAVEEPITVVNHFLKVAGDPPKEGL